jgi:hypothetical protein
VAGCAFTEQPSHGALLSLWGASHEKEMVMRYVVLWALGVPISGIIILHLLGFI